MPSSSLFDDSGEGACMVCDQQDCTHSSKQEHHHTYPFLPGGRDPLQGQRFVIAPHAIEDPSLERVVYGAGDRVPWADAVKFGLVPADELGERAKHGPVEDRAKARSEDR